VTHRHESETAVTVAEGWERYARQHVSRHADQNLGEEWNEPKKMGLSVQRPSDVVSELDARVFGRFIGSPDTVVEIGAGGGRFTELLASRCQRLIAADTSPTMLRLARDRLGEDPTISYIVLDGYGLTGVADESADVVFSYDVFVHLHHWDIFRYLCEIHRILVPEGKAVIHHSSTFSELGWVEFLVDLPHCVGGHTTHDNFSVMTPALFQEFVLRAGLRVERMITEVVLRDCIALLRK
jgi:ubiquinone/menaquinone biosynthesis C-methylase UbiE